MDENVCKFLDVEWDYVSTVAKSTVFIGLFGAFVGNAIIKLCLEVIHIEIGGHVKFPILRRVRYITAVLCPKS